MAAGSIVKSFSSPGANPWGLTFDGKYLWNADYGGTIYCIDRSGHTIKSFAGPYPAYNTGITFDGKNLWICNYHNGMVYCIDRSGHTIKSFAGPYPAYNTGITFDGKNLWLSNYYGAKIYCLDRSGHIIKYFNNTRLGLTFDGKNLWTIYPTHIECSSRNGKTIKTIATPSSNTRGVTFDGKHIWISDQVTRLIYCLTRT